MRCLRLAVLAGLWVAAGQVFAQQATIHAPFITGSSGFFEQTGVQWSGNWGSVPVSVWRSGPRPARVRRRRSLRRTLHRFLRLGPKRQLQPQIQLGTRGHKFAGRPDAEHYADERPDRLLLGHLADALRYGFYPCRQQHTDDRGRTDARLDPSAASRDFSTGALGNSRVQDFIQGATAGSSSSARSDRRGDPGRHCWTSQQWHTHTLAAACRRAKRIPRAAPPRASPKPGGCENWSRPPTRRKCRPCGFAPDGRRGREAGRGEDLLSNGRQAGHGRHAAAGDRAIGRLADLRPLRAVYPHFIAQSSGGTGVSPVSSGNTGETPVPPGVSLSVSPKSPRRRSSSP